MAVEIRTVAEEEVPAYFRTISAGFGSPGSPDEDFAEWQTVAEYDQCFGALDGDRFVGGASAYSLEMTLPGGGLATIGGVSNVAVLPTHRRQGVLTGLLSRQLDDLAERGRPLAALNASESRIYRRFGYGVATDSVSVEIDTRHTEYLSDLPPGRLHLVTVEEARSIFPAFYERWRRTRTGSLSRSEAWWDIMLGSREGWKGGGEAFHLVHEDATGEVDGYASYQPQSKTEHGNFQSVVRVRELIGATGGVEAALWRFCFDLDLVRRARSDMRPVDDPLRWWLVEPRQLSVTSLTDVLWLRIVDAAAALSERRYATDGGLVLEVDDPFRTAGSGRYRLEGGPDGAACNRDGGATPDLRLDVADLGAAYLGGVSFSLLAAGGRVEELTPGAAARADALFRTDRAPYCATTF